MKIFNDAIHRTTRGHSEVQDLTADLREMVQSSGIQTGQLTAMVVGSTASLSTTEFEPGLVNHDLAAAMETFAPTKGRYIHEETWHDDNGHSHVRATLMGPSLSLPVVNGDIPLGTWQQVILIDFDTRERHREIVVVVVGQP